MKIETEKLNKVSKEHLKELWFLAENEIKDWEKFIQTIKKELRGRRK